MRSSKILLGFLAGAAVGALAGVLFAPDKGSNTRHKIAKKTGDLSDSVKNSFSDFIDRIKEIYSGGSEEGEQFADKVKSTMYTTKNEVKNDLS